MRMSVHRLKQVPHVHMSICGPCLGPCVYTRLCTCLCTCTFTLDTCQCKWISKHMAMHRSMQRACWVRPNYILLYACRTVLHLPMRMSMPIMHAPMHRPAHVCTRVSTRRCALLCTWLRTGNALSADANSLLCVYTHGACTQFYACLHTCRFAYLHIHTHMPAHLSVQVVYAQTWRLPVHLEQRHRAS